MVPVRLQLYEVRERAAKGTSAAASGQDGGGSERGAA